MGRRKSAFARVMNGRYLRWAASRAMVGAVPAARGRLNFYGAGVAMADAADALLFEEAITVARPLRPDQETFVAERCQENDGGGAPQYWRAPWRFVDARFLLSETTFLGHTGRMIDRARRGVVTDWGEPENWNRDKIALLRAAPPQPGVSIPVRAYKSYFHFMMDVAVPTVAYFEHPARAQGPHTLLSAPNPRPFVRETLAAIAARYGAELREIHWREKVVCERAVALRRESPCPDWYPVTRATADALKAALLAHAPAEARERAAAAAGPRLFLRRGREKLRNLDNAAGLDALAAERGYAAFQPAAENFLEQVVRADAAEEILAVHGAALANLLFVRPGARLVEIFDGAFCKSVYMALAQMLEIEHVASVGGPGDAWQNFAADLDHAARTLAPPPR